MRKIWGQTSPRKEIRHLIGVAFWPLFQGSSKLICWMHADSSFFLWRHWCCSLQIFWKYIHSCQSWDWVWWLKTLCRVAWGSCSSPSKSRKQRPPPPPVRFPVSHLKFGQKLLIKCLSIASSSPYSKFGESLGLKGILRPILCIDINTHSYRKWKIM